MKNIGCFFILLALFSCTGNKLEKQLKKFIGTEIHFPDNLQAYIQGRDTLMHLSHIPMKMVVWYDSIGCASCRIQQMYDWNEIIQYASEISDFFEPIFIFSPKIIDLYNVNIYLRMADFEYPVYIDNRSFFHEINPDIPSDERMHTFLLDKNNKVVLVGSPLHNEPLWELYKELIEIQMKR